MRRCRQPCWHEDACTKEVGEVEMLSGRVQVPWSARCGDGVLPSLQHRGAQRLVVAQGNTPLVIFLGSFTRGIWGSAGGWGRHRCWGMTIPCPSTIFGDA
eukprot:327347-Chlamydomonas_euryale.AAC.1